MTENRIVTLRELYSVDFELNDIFAMRQKWVKGALFQRPRPRHLTGIIYLKSCKGVYTDITGEAFTAPPKSIVCLPMGSQYTCLNAECSSTLDDAVIVEFNAVRDDIPFTFGDRPFLISDVNPHIAFGLFNDIIQAFESSVPSPLIVKTALYRLLAYLCTEKARNHQKRYGRISAGIELIEANPLSDISIEDIAEACDVTPCYFRRLFKEYSGKSPSEYRMELRLNMAKQMLEGGESTLEYIAEALNFESTSYFCRIFKKKFGMTAGQYRDSYSETENR
ncbi:MAG: helix-turn-helix transcriptional regulator [Oscillospiraceae bacterium]|nr:helix-turn-helix transcriptional regulator [Oscillospiraceae bacterium]